ncbi:MAG: XdhC family protein [Dokdonella sp.]
MSSASEGSAPRAVIAALLDAALKQCGVLGLVIATEGSTYAKAGTILSLGSAARCGWISGGCLEPMLETEALRIEEEGAGLLLELDTRDDMDLMFGTRMGCRGLLQMALLPMAMVEGIEPLLTTWRDGEQTLLLGGDHCSFSAAIGDQRRRWDVDWQRGEGVELVLSWSIRIAAPPRVLVLGAGPETHSLLRNLRDLGVRVDVVESRPRWIETAAEADCHIQSTPDQALVDTALAAYSAVLVMNHDFERDRESLDALTATTNPWIGLLGPPRRRDDLLALLTPEQRDSLTPRLHAPVGLPLGGHGPEAIALSIAAQLQMLWNAVDG